VSYVDRSVARLRDHRSRADRPRRVSIGVLECSTRGSTQATLTSSATPVTSKNEGGVLRLVRGGAAPGAVWPHTENQAAVSVVAPLVTVGTGEVPVVARVAPVGPTSGAGRVSVAVEQPVCVRLHAPLVLAGRADEVGAHTVTVGPPRAHRRRGQRCSSHSVMAMEPPRTPTMRRRTGRSGRAC
jgi:hypothetical protein